MEVGPIRLFLIIVGLLVCWQVEARDTVAGPVSARVLNVRDGDTVMVEALIWPGQRVQVAVRIVGIDTPEMKAECGRDRAIAARDAVRFMVGDGKVTLYDIRGGKYFGRVLARVVTSDGRDIAETLLRDGLAQPYSGRGAKFIAYGC